MSIKLSGWEMVILNNSGEAKELIPIIAKLKIW